MYMYNCKYSYYMFMYKWFLFSSLLVYTDVQFVTEPSDVYTTQSLNIARFYCRATGLFVATNTTVLLDTRFLLDDDLLTSKFFPADRHEYLIDGDDDYVVGIMVRPIQPSDNGNVYKCQVMINGMPVPMFSRSALLTVGGETTGSLSDTRVCYCHIREGYMHDMYCIASYLYWGFIFAYFH